MCTEFYVHFPQSFSVVYYVLSFDTAVLFFPSFPPLPLLWFSYLSKCLYGYLLFIVIYLFHNSSSVWFIFSSRLLHYTFRSLISTFSSQGDRGESDLDGLLEFSLAESRVMRLNALFEYSSSKTFGYTVSELSGALLLTMISLCLFNPGCTLKRF